MGLEKLFSKQERVFNQKFSRDDTEKLHTELGLYSIHSILTANLRKNNFSHTSDLRAELQKAFVLNQ